jgi:hypothetical protein
VPLTNTVTREEIPNPDAEIGNIFRTQLPKFRAFEFWTFVVL